MKIFKCKSPNSIIYDTDDIDSRNFNACKEDLIPLHQTHNETDFEFLAGLFPKDHPIFDNFGQSYYYILGHTYTNNNITT